MTAATLAELVNTSQAQISRLETGERELTEDWMRRIATALEVEPADLLECATFVNLEDEVQALAGVIGRTIISAIEERDLLILKVTGRQLQNLDIGPGAEAVFKTSPKDISSVSTGDVVLVKVTRLSDGKSARILRQFIAPNILTTNRKGRNVTISLDEPKFNVEIIGVLIQPKSTPR